MQPRLPSSRKWTPLPPELVHQIKSVFRESFQAYISGGEIEASGRIYPEEILIRVGYLAPKSLKQNNWEISISYRKEKDNVLKLLHLGLDAIGALFQQLFEAEHDHDFPRIWEAVDFDGQQIFVQYTTVNTGLESEADRLLGLTPEDHDADRVAQGEWDEDITPEQIKAQLGLSRDEEDDGEGAMFEVEVDGDDGARVDTDERKDEDKKSRKPMTGEDSPHGKAKAQKSAKVPARKPPRKLH